MSGVTVNVKTDLGVLSRAARAEKAAVVAVSLRVIQDSDQFVPIVSGALRGTAETQSVPEKGLVRYGGGRDVPYARAQYYRHPNKTRAGTTMRWFEKAKSLYMAEWLRTAEAAVKGALHVD